MARVRRTRPRAGERLLRRLVLMFAIGLAGLLGGAIAWPVLRTSHYLMRLDSPEPAKRLEAMNVIGGLCERDPTCAGPFVDAVLSESAAGSPEMQATAERIAIAVLDESPTVGRTLAARLRDADDETFLRIAALFRKAGLWRQPHRTLDELIKRETIRMKAPDAPTRVAALQALAELGPNAGGEITHRLDAWRADSSDVVRQALARAAAVCLEAAQAREALSSLCGDAAPIVRREAVIQTALHGDKTRAAMLRDPSASVRQAAAWGMGHQRDSSDVHSLLRLLADDPNSEVNAMAAWAIGRAQSSVALPMDALALVQSADSPLAARMAVAIGRTGQAEDAYVSLAPLVTSRSVELALAAVFAIGKLPPDSQHREAGIALLRDVIESSLHEGHGVVTAAACEALARLGDKPFAPVMHDIAGEIDDQPMVQYAAAVAALQLDEPLGVSALLGLLDSEADPVCDLATIQLGSLRSVPIEDLARLLTDGDERARASAALALGFAGVPAEQVGERRLSDALRCRTDPACDVYEQAWKPHGYYLCARLLLGDNVRDALEPFIRNENFCRVGLYATLLHAGDPLPMDLLLMRDSSIDVDSFLCDAHFIDVIRDRFPDAPTFEWFEDQDLRRWQRERMRDWWAIRRWRR